MSDLYALTVRQPWAFAIAHGTKRVENRSWLPPLRLTEVAIHAGARSGWDEDGEFSPPMIAAWREYAAGLPPGNAALPHPRRDSLHMDFGAVVAVVTLAACHHSDDCDHICPEPDDWDGVHLPCAEHDGACNNLCSAWSVHEQYHWPLRDVRTLATPVPCRGYQKLWTVPDEVERAIRAQLDAQLGEPR